MRPKPRLRLYVAGDTPSAHRARESAERLVQALGDGAALEVIDVLATPAAAEAARILATPTLSDESTHPPRRIVGDLRDIPRMLRFLGYTMLG